MKKIAVIMALFMSIISVNSYAIELRNSDKIEILRKNGYINGYEDKSLHLERNITRSEITKLLSLGSKNEDVVKRLKNQKSRYSDVNRDHWANGYINAASCSPVKSNRLYMIKGYPDGTFRPEKNISYSEMAKMLSILSDSELTKSEMSENDSLWPDGWIEKAKSLGITKGISDIKPDKLLNREEAFVMYYNALNKINSFNEGDYSKNDQNMNYSGNYPDNIKFNQKENVNIDLNNINFVSVKDINNISEMGRDILFGNSDIRLDRKDGNLYNIKLAPQEDFIRNVVDDGGNSVSEKVSVNTDRIEQYINRVLLDAKRKGRLCQNHINEIGKYAQIEELSEENGYIIEEKINEILENQKELKNHVKVCNIDTNVPENFQINNFKELLVAISENMIRNGSDLRFRIGYNNQVFQRDLNLAIAMNYSGKRPQEVDYYSIDNNTMGIIIHYPKTEEQTDIKVKQIIENILYEEMTDYEKIKTIHDYIIDNAEYKLDGSDISHDAAGVILNGKGVCESYTNAFQKLCNAASIPCVELVGRSQDQNHAWNAVKIDGAYYLIDTTWDDTEKGPIYRFFLIDSKNFISHEDYVMLNLKDSGNIYDVRIPIEKIVDISPLSYDTGYRYKDEI